MKKSLLIIPIFLFLLLNACGNTPVEVSPAQGTMVAQTQTASVWTPTITPTIDPNEPQILEWLNAGLPADQLETTLVVKYLAVDVSFPPETGSSSLIFRIDLRCQCATYDQCCSPERMFVVTMWAMKSQKDKIIGQVPGSTSLVKVVCYNHVSQIGVVAASWPDVKGYLLDQISGYQLGSHTFRSSLP